MSGSLGDIEPVETFEVESDTTKLARANLAVGATLQAYGVQPDNSFDQNWVHLDQYVTGLRTATASLNEKVRVLEEQVIGLTRAGNEMELADAKRKKFSAVLVLATHRVARLLAHADHSDGTGPRQDAIVAARAAADALEKALK